jgi:hypothetical protein
MLIGPQKGRHFTKDEQPQKGAKSHKKDLTANGRQLTLIF